MLFAIPKNEQSNITLIHPIKWRVLPSDCRVAGITREDPEMAAKKDEKKVPMPKKTYWHLYSLQNLQSNKLAEIVNKILKREFQVIK